MHAPHALAAPGGVEGGVRTGAGLSHQRLLTHQRLSSASCFTAAGSTSCLPWDAPRAFKPAFFFLIHPTPASPPQDASLSVALQVGGGEGGGQQQQQEEPAVAAPGEEVSLEVVVSKGGRPLQNTEVTLVAGEWVSSVRCVITHQPTAQIPSRGTLVQVLEQD